MKKIYVFASIILTYNSSSAQSHNDYMGGRGVAGAADFYLQVIIVLIIVIAAIYICLRILGVFYKQKEKHDRIIKEYLEQKKKVAENRTIYAPFHGYAISHHILTVYSSSPVYLCKYVNGDFESSKVAFLSIDDVTFDEDNFYHDDVVYYHPEEIIEDFNFNEQNCEYKIEPHEEYCLSVDYSFEVKERYIIPILNQNAVKIIKYKYNNKHLFVFDTIDYYGKRLKLIEI